MTQTDSPAQSEPVRQFRFRLPPGGCDIILVRHGESQPAVPGVAFPTVNGQADPPLADEGHREARAMADRLRHEDVSAIYTSSLTRTKQTAAPLAEYLGITPVEEPDLREVYLGEWDGGEYRIRMRSGDPLVADIVAQQDWAPIPGAESMADLCARVKPALERIAARHADQRVVVVAHGGVIGAALHLATRADQFAFVVSANASISHLVITEDRWILRRFNDTGHLATDLDKPVQPMT
ncbi:histidine phosphatase family protein [Euzebya tangerina]|uniref:histidine phosphatase family protein n=1 Tax=Euzebya tangerina TaxID=591198 RepID=UPI000E32467B|nr:histidine phosphatase family protein [Euzebya tangerina]